MEARINAVTEVKTTKSCEEGEGRPSAMNLEMTADAKAMVMKAKKLCTMRRMIFIFCCMVEKKKDREKARIQNVQMPGQSLKIEPA